MSENDTEERKEGKAQEEWVGMPEFKMEKQRPLSKITGRLETEEDLQEFAKLIGQKVTPKTKSIWHPHKPHKSGLVRRWVDES